MWLSIFIVLGIIIYLLIRPAPQDFTRRIFSGIETVAIIVIDDPIGGMENVVDSFVMVMGIPERQSIKLMFRIHNEGLAIVWTGDRNEADQHLQRLRAKGLRCFISEINME